MGGFKVVAPQKLSDWDGISRFRVEQERIVGWLVLPSGRRVDLEKNILLQEGSLCEVRRGSGIDDVLIDIFVAH